MDDTRTGVACAGDAIADQGDLPTAMTMLRQGRAGKERGEIATHAHSCRRDNGGALARFEHDRLRTRGDDPRERIVVRDLPALREACDGGANPSFQVRHDRNALVTQCMRIRIGRDQNIIVLYRCETGSGQGASERRIGKRRYEDARLGIARFVERRDSRDVAVIDERQRSDAKGFRKGRTDAGEDSHAACDLGALCAGLGVKPRHRGHAGADPGELGTSDRFVKFWRQQQPVPIYGERSHKTRV